MRTPRNDTLASDIVDRCGAPEGAAERRCVLSGKTAARDDLVRLALAPDGAVLPDALARAPGRGAWIGVDRAALERAAADGKLKAALSRAFKTGAVTVPDDLGQRTADALSRAFLQRLGLELRAGRLILGSDRIAEQARQGRVAALYHAADASEDGARKLDQAFRVGRDAEGSTLGGVRLPLDRTALSVALGRDNVVHLAFADRASAERIALPLRRLQNFAGAERAPAGPASAQSARAAE